MGEVADAMRDFRLKVDALRRSLLSNEELLAYRRALVLVAGEEHLF
jgi:hypothetical protein